MVDLMNNQYPGYSHLFGGEVRYRSNYLKDDMTYANLALLGKVTPAYDGLTYDETGTSLAMSVALTYSSAGTWSITHSGTGAWTPGGATTGNFAVATLNPSGYEYRISAITVNANTGASNPTAASVPTGWTTIITSVTVCSVSITSGGAKIQDDLFTIELRPVGFPAEVVSSTINLITDGT
jgi:hypothetical protein